MWETVGIGEREARVYEALVHHGQMGVHAIADHLGLTQSQLARALAELIDKGMVTRLPGRPARYGAVPPDQAAGTLIAEHEQQLASLRGHARHLATSYRRAHASWRHPADLVEVVEGESSLAATIGGLQRRARTRVRVFDRPPYLADPAAENEDETHHQARGLTYQVIYDHAAVAVPGRMTDIWSSIHKGEQARVGAVPMKMLLCDDDAALIPVSFPDHAPDAAYLVHPSSLLDALIALFEVIWHRSVPFNRPAAGDATEELGPEDTDLIGLLAAGSTDEAIARTLGWSVRTVRRHVHTLMSDLGAQSRFQLGMEAIRRGWV